MTASSGEATVLDRTFVVEVSTEHLDRMRHQGHGKSGHVVLCDESVETGGESSAPGPLTYMALGIGF